MLTGQQQIVAGRTRQAHRGEPGSVLPENLSIRATGIGHNATVERERLVK
ncbi:hypothetical protein [Micromonospora sp. NPDC048839]